VPSPSESYRVLRSVLLFSSCALAHVCFGPEADIAGGPLVTHVCFSSVRNVLLLGAAMIAG
jgi:hypothetical protein